MPYNGINDSTLPDNVKTMSDKERRIFIASFNRTYRNCDLPEQECEKLAFQIAYSSVKNLSRAIQDIPNLTEVSLSDIPKACGTCIFWSSGYCNKYNTATMWEWKCDSYSGKDNDPNISASHNVNSSMFAIDLSNNKDLAEIQLKIKSFFKIPYYIEWSNPKDFHITLAYLPKTSELDENLIPDMVSFSIDTDKLELWESEDDKFAIVLTIQENESLRSLQSQIVRSLDERGIEVGEYARMWKPHITLGYICYVYGDDDSIEELESPSVKFTNIPVQKVIYTNWNKIQHEKSMSNTDDIMRIDMLIRSINERSFEDEEYTEITMLGFPYDGPVSGGKDLHRTFFSRNSDLGDLTHAMPVYFDHGVFDYATQDPELKELIERVRFTPITYLGSPDKSNPYVAKAIIAEETDEGRLLKVLIDKRNQYEKLLRELHNRGILRGSAQSILSMYQTNDSTGEILRFHPGEFSFTVTPSNDYNSSLEVKNIIRAMFIEENFEKMDNEEVKTENPERAVTEDGEMEEEEGTEKAFPPKKEKKPVMKSVASVEIPEASQPIERTLELTEVVNTLRAIQNELIALREDTTEAMRILNENQDVLARSQQATIDEVSRRTPEEIARIFASFSSTEKEVIRSIANTDTTPAPAPRKNRSGLRSPWE